MTIKSATTESTSFTFTACTLVMLALCSAAGCSNEATVPPGSDAGRGTDGGVIHTDGSSAADGGVVATDTGASTDGSALTDTSTPVDAAGPSAYVVFSTSNYSNAGELGAISGATRVASTRVATTDQDTVVATSNIGRAYALERGAGNLVLLDVTATGIAINSRIALGAATAPYSYNPQSALQINANEVYVTFGADSQIAVVNVSTRLVSRMIDLSPLASSLDTESNVNAAAMALSADGTRAFVALGRYFFEGPQMRLAAGSVLAVIDTATHQLVDTDSAMAGTQGVALTAPNPIALVWSTRSSTLLIASVGLYGSNDGAIMELNPTTLALSPVTDETALGGDIDTFTADTESGAIFVSAGGRLLSVMRGAAPSAAPIATGVSMVTVANATLFVGVRVATDAGTGSAIRTFALPALSDNTPAGGIAVGAHGLASLGAVL